MHSPPSPVDLIHTEQRAPGRSTVDAIVWLSPSAHERLVFLAVAGGMIVAGGLVAAVNGATPFAHGSWLAAYLVLVGGIAQLGLGVGCLLLPRADRSKTLRQVQLLLWNVGILTVAGGVLANLYGVVVTGSLVVAGALASFAGASGAPRKRGRTRVIVYRAVIGLLAISVVIGALLAHGTTTG